MQRYLYTGPNSSVTLSLPPTTPNGDPVSLDLMLWHDKILELPEDNEYVRTLLAQGYLNPVLVTDVPKPKVLKEETK